ncbi:hypothetical protein, partial [Stenotrophomonas maltophilia]|uniref:hypothetical protein n=1 Tax=Stenotrophomonas maltophilia TaxID=40324 RepID=UPI0013DA801E
LGLVFCAGPKRPLTPADIPLSAGDNEQRIASLSIALQRDLEGDDKFFVANMGDLIEDDQAQAFSEALINQHPTVFHFDHPRRNALF